MNNLIHNSIELMRGLHMWWKSMHVKQAYDVTIRLKKDQAPYVETIIIPSAYKIKMASKESVVRGYSKEVLGSEEYPLSNYDYIISDESKKDCYILNICTDNTNNGLLNINLDDISSGTKIDFLIKITDINGILPNKKYIQIGSNWIRGGLTLTSAIADANYIISSRYEMIFSMTIEKIDNDAIITAFSPMPSFIVNRNNSTVAMFNPYNGMFKDPFNG